MAKKLLAFFKNIRKSEISGRQHPFGLSHDGTAADLLAGTSRLLHGAPTPRGAKTHLGL